MRRLRRFTLLCLGLLTFTVVRVQACATRRDEAARLAFLSERINHHALPGWAPGAPFDGEWRLVTLSMSVVAATNLAHREPETRAARAKQVSEWVRQLRSDEVREYDTTQWAGSDALASLEGFEGHAGYLGHLALAMDAACLLGAERDEVLHRQVIAALARRIAHAPDGLIETYPGETYVPDNMVVLAALAQFDACEGDGAHAALIANWEATLQARWVDPTNGLFVFAPGQPARGSGAAWNSFYLPFIDERLAADQSRRLWATFGDEALGGWLAGVQEGVGADVDSGPLVLGVSPSATGFALADATLRGRPERDGLLRTAELVGVSFNGRYLLSPLVGDAIVLAAKTATRWNLVKSSQNGSIGVVAGTHDSTDPRSADR